MGRHTIVLTVLLLVGVIFKEGSAWRDTTEETSVDKDCADQKNRRGHAGPPKGSAGALAARMPSKEEMEAALSEIRHAGFTEDQARNAISKWGADDALTKLKAQHTGYAAELENAVTDSEATRETVYLTNELRRNPVMCCFLGIMALVIVLMLLASIRRRMAPLDFIGEEVDRQGNKVDVGTTLVCICKEAEGAAEIFQEVASSEVIGVVRMGEKVTALGRAADHAGSMMVPVQPQGAVKLENFREEKALNIVTGNVLSCKTEDAHAYVYENVSSKKVLGKVSPDECVAVKSAPEWSNEGQMMIPIRPYGAVELTFFEPKQGGEDDATETWIRNELEGAHELDDKLKKLRAQKTKLLMEQAARKKKLETIVQNMLEVEAEKEGRDAPTQDDVKQKTEEALKNANMAKNRGVLMAIAYAAPFVTQSQKIYQAMEVRMENARQKGVNLMVEETKKFTKELQHCIGLQDMSDVDYDLLDEINIPSLAVLLASAVAPVQLRILYGVNKALFGLSLVFVLLDIGTIVFDWRTPCGNAPVKMPPNPTFKTFFHVWSQDAITNQIYMWFLADFVVHCLCTLVRYPVISDIGAQLEKHDLSSNQAVFIHYDEDGETESVDPIAAIRKLVEFYMTTGFTTLMQLDAVCRSYAVFMANFSSVFDVCWIMYGTYLVWNTPWPICKEAGVIILRIRSTIFLVLFVFYLLQLVMFLLGQLIQTEGFSVAVVRVGDQIDTALQLGLPIGKVVCHALVIRHSSDMIAVQLNMHKTEKERLAQKQARRMQQLQEVNRALESSSKAIEKLEYENAYHSSSFREAAAIQEEMLKMKEAFKEKSFRFSKQVADRAVVATKNAEQKIEEWERGEGPEAFTALARGDGLAAAADILSEQMNEAGSPAPEEDAQNLRSSGHGLIQQQEESAQQVGSGATSAAAASGTSVAEVASGASSAAATFGTGATEAVFTPRGGLPSRLPETAAATRSTPEGTAAGGSSSAPADVMGNGQGASSATVSGGPRRSVPDGAAGGAPSSQREPPQSG